MRLTSSVFENGGIIPARYTCDGENISPPLWLEAVPAAAKSLVLIMEDPDVPRQRRADGMWDHWVVFNMPPATAGIPEGEKPPGVLGTGTGGVTGYQGPCPPDREHRYFFKLLALDIGLDLPAGVTKRAVEQAMAGRVLVQAELMGRYKRPGQG